MTTQQMVTEMQANLNLKLAKEIETFEAQANRVLTHNERLMVRLGFAWGSQHATNEVFKAQLRIKEGV